MFLVCSSLVVSVLIVHMFALSLESPYLFSEEGFLFSRKVHIPWGFSGQVILGFMAKRRFLFRGECCFVRGKTPGRGSPFLLEEYQSHSPPTSSSLSMGYGAEPRAPKVLLSFLTAFVGWEQRILMNLIDEDLNEFSLEKHENTFR